MDPLSIAAVLLIAFAAWARLNAWRASKRYRLTSLDDAITKLYEDARKYGDPIHISLGIYTAKLLSLSNPYTALAAAFLTALYTVYQIVERDNSVAKDIAVYTATFAVAYAYYSGIPIPLRL
ncbi:MAG: hypothetical protein ACP5I3_10280 [Thermoproteus sp.]